MTDDISNIADYDIEPAISAGDESYNRLERDQRRHWHDVLEEICAEYSLILTSRHLLSVGKKPSS